MKTNIQRFENLLEVVEAIDSVNDGTDSAITALYCVVEMARSDDRRKARLLLAACILDNLPLIAARNEVRRMTLYAMLVTRAFGLLSKVVMALQGTAVRVTIASNNRDKVESPQWCRKPSSASLMIDSRWLDDLSVDDPFLNEWTLGLASGSSPKNSSA
jgi:hypothetical protein